MQKKMMMTLGAVLLAALEAFGGPDLHINGDFRGAPSGQYIVPGWMLTADGGGARILPTHKHDEFALELRATPNRSQSAVSDLRGIFGNALKLDAKVRGNGEVTLRYEAFDAARQTIVATEGRKFRLSAYDQEFKVLFVLNAPTARYVRVVLTAEHGSVAVIRDLDAEFKTVAAPAPTPAVIAAPAPAEPAVVAAPAPAEPAVVAAPAPAEPAVAAAPAPVVAPAPAAPLPRPKGPPLINDRYYSYRSLPAVAHFQVSLPVGSDIDFELGEDMNRNLYWSLVRYDNAICRVKLEHDRDGVFPFRRDKAEIELKALQPGYTIVEFACGGKRVFVYFTAL